MAQGDLLCKVVVETPVNLSREQKDLLTQFQESLENAKKPFSTFQFLVCWSKKIF